MAIIKAVSSKASIGHALDYVMKNEKTEKRYMSGINCQVDTVKSEMLSTKKAWGKTDGRTYKHFVQSFAEGENINPKKAHEIACEFARSLEQWKRYEVLVSTHVDKKHVHTHFIVNSVSFLDGHKINQSKKDLQKMKEVSDSLCKKQGLVITQKGKTFEGEDREETVSWSKEAYQVLKKAENENAVKVSYVHDIAIAIIECSEKALSKQDFISKMAEKGYGVNWQDSHKYITFTDLERVKAGEKKSKIRNNKLEKYYNIPFRKENLQNEFIANKQRSLAENNRIAVGDITERLVDSQIERRKREIERAYKESEQRRLEAEAKRKNQERSRNLDEPSKRQRGPTL